MTGKTDATSSVAGESDTERDGHLAASRATGGQPGRQEHDSASTTGPGESGSFVGRIAGNDDVGAVGETGAEARGIRGDNGQD